MVGGGAVHDFGPLTTKLRGSYGKSIRPAGIGGPIIVGCAGSDRAGAVSRPKSKLESRSGFDAFIGHAFAAHLTRFDQTAYNLIQPVAITSSLMPHRERFRASLYALQNVGEIGNEVGARELARSRCVFRSRAPLARRQPRPTFSVCLQRRPRVPATGCLAFRRGPAA